MQVRALGKGAYGVALLMRAKDSDEELVAVKYIERGDQVRNICGASGEAL